MAAADHFRLCRAILLGFRNQLKHDGVYKDGFMGMLEAGQEMESPPAFKLTNGLGEVLLVQVEGEKIFKDDLTGQPLDPKFVAVARAKGLEYFESKGVWKMKPIEDARRRTEKPPVTVRWVDDSKGDDLNQNIRSRLVAC